MLHLSSGENVSPLIPWGCNQSRRQRVELAVGTFRFHFCPFGCVFSFLLLFLFSLNAPPLLDSCFFLLFLQYWSFPSRLRAALRVMKIC